MIPSLPKTCSSFRQARVHGGADGHLGGQGSGGDADLRGWWLTPAQLHLVQELGHQPGTVFIVHSVPALLSRWTYWRTRVRWWRWPARQMAHPRPATSGTGTRHQPGTVFIVHSVPALLSSWTYWWTRFRWWRWPSRLMAHPRPTTSGTGTQTSIRYCAHSPPSLATPHPPSLGDGFV